MAVPSQSRKNLEEAKLHLLLIELKSNLQLVGIFYIFLIKVSFLNGS